MDSPLWIDTHAPDLADLPQAELRRYLSRVSSGPINLLLHGPAGSGKTAAVRALARETHEDADNDLVEINVADFFQRTKKEIREVPRFSPFLQGQTPFSKQFRDGTGKDNRYKREWSKREMLAHVVKEVAGYRPSSGEYKTVLLDNAEAAREDFQHALRRVMERHYRTTQFVIATRQPSKLIPAIRSRCFPVPVRAPSHDEIVGVLADVADAEDVEYDDEGPGFVAGHAEGDLRRALLEAQTVAADTGSITREGAYEALRTVGVGDRVDEMLDAAEAGEFADARAVLDDLIYDAGYTGEEVLETVVGSARSRDGTDPARLARLAGEVDRDLNRGTNDRLHLSHLLAELGADA